jgi:hypothetical protein
MIPCSSANGSRQAPGHFGLLVVMALASTRGLTPRVREPLANCEPLAVVISLSPQLVFAATSLFNALRCHDRMPRTRDAAKVARGFACDP